MMATSKRNRALGLIGTIAGIIVATLTIWTFIRGSVAGATTRETRQEATIEEHCKTLEDREARLRTIEASMNEQRPIWRAVARKLDVELPGGKP